MIRTLYNIFNFAGSTYVYYSANGISGWSQTAKLLSSDAVTKDYFGEAVSVAGKMIVVGASGEDNEKGTEAGELLNDLEFEGTLLLSLFLSSYIFHICLPMLA